MAELTYAKVISNDLLDGFIEANALGYPIMNALRELKALREQCKRQRTELEDLERFGPVLENDGYHDPFVMMEAGGGEWVKYEDVMRCLFGSALSGR